MATIQIDGVEELRRAIIGISDDKLKRRELLKILRRQAKPLLNAIRMEAPVAKEPIKIKGETYLPQNLKKSFAIQTGKSKKYPNVFVGPRRGKKHKYDGWYAHFLLYGTDKIKGNDFVKTGADRTMPSITQTASEEVKKYVEIQSKKAIQ